MSQHALGTRPPAVRSVLAAQRAFEEATVASLSAGIALQQGGLELARSTTRAQLAAWAALSDTDIQRTHEGLGERFDAALEEAESEATTALRETAASVAETTERLGTVDIDSSFDAFLLDQETDAATVVADDRN